MKSLSEFNIQFEKEWDAFVNKKELAGVLCNQCGTEMVYRDNTVLTSFPPKRNVRCLNCGAQGYKYGG